MATSETSNLVETVTGEAARLREFLSGLDAETWASDSTCEGWTIEDVVAHLAGSASGWARTITRAVAGDAGPPEGLSWRPGSVALTPPGKPVGRPASNRGPSFWTCLPPGTTVLGSFWRAYPTKTGKNPASTGAVPFL